MASQSLYSLKIKAVGIGRVGTLIVEHLVSAELTDVEFLVLNAKQNIDSVTGGNQFYCGSSRPLKVLAPDDGQGIEAELKEAHLIFIIGRINDLIHFTATSSALHLAKEKGALIIGITVIPHIGRVDFRAELNDIGRKLLLKNLASLITIPAGPDFSSFDIDNDKQPAFLHSAQMAFHAVLAITETNTIPGLIDIDYADVSRVMQQRGLASVGHGTASGPGRAVQATRKAICSSIFDYTISDARGVLLFLKASSSMRLTEIEEAINLLQESAPFAEHLSTAAVVDDTFAGKLTATVIATGLDI